MNSVSVRPGRDWVRRNDQASQVGPSYQDCLAEDKIVPPEDIRCTSNDPDLLSYDFTRHRYFDKEFHDREVKGLWSRVWQMACREEEIPEPGDISVYEIAGSSFIIVRGEDLKIRAFRNTCMHRGMKLCEQDTVVSELKCPFHGFTWDLAGNLIDVPMRWDFPNMKDDSVRLSEVQVGLWGGFVFINPDPDAPSLESFLGVLPRHMSGYMDYSDKYITRHVKKIFPCNWKLGVEVFLESYHTLVTHPQFTGFLADENGQYDVYGPHVSRFILPTGKQAPAIAENLSEQAVVNEFFVENELGTPPTVAEGVTARAFLSEYMRDFYTAKSGRDYSSCPETELIDTTQYSLFPNLIVWRTLLFPAVYRIRPNGNDPHSCIWEWYFMADVPSSGIRPPAAEMEDISDITFTEALKNYSPLMGVTYDQDFRNLTAIQQGISGALDVPMQFAEYQEIRIKHLEKTLDAYLDKYAPETALGQNAA